MFNLNLSVENCWYFVLFQSERKANWNLTYEACLHWRFGHHKIKCGLIWVRAWFIARLKCEICSNATFAGCKLLSANRCIIIHQLCTNAFPNGLKLHIFKLEMLMIIAHDLSRTTPVDKIQSVHFFILLNYRQPIIHFFS